MKKSILTLIAMTCCLVYTTPLWAWGQEGHRVIAQVAYDHLSKKARKQVDAILGTNGMIYNANWPDEIKSDTIYPQSHNWHFQDLDGGQSDSTIVSYLTRYPEVGGRLFCVYDSLESVLRADRHDRDALVFLIHLTGDRFCPVHMGHLEDLGGNKVRMAWFSRSENTNLHAVWDSKLIDSQGYSFSEYARFLEDTYASRRREIEAASWAELTLRTYHLTSAIYDYQTSWDGNTWHYIYRWHQPMEYQLYCAGIRLAKLINSIYY